MFKHNSDSTVAYHKVHLVAQDYYQEHYLDYNKVFSIVAKMPTLYILLIISLHFNWKIQQLVVSNAFLHGLLDEIVFMAQPSNFNDQHYFDDIHLLKRVIYGLNKSPCQ